MVPAAVLSSLKSGARVASRARTWNALEPRRLLAQQSYVVTVTDDSLAPGTLRSAILAANQDPDPNPFDIVFNIPASSAPDLNVPQPGFNPITQTWQITLNSALPTITHAVSIDGFSQANNPIPLSVFERSDRGGSEICRSWAHRQGGLSR